MSDDVVKFAESFASDFVGTVKAMDKARAQRLDNILARLHDADEARDRGLAEVRKMQEEAGKLVAASIKLAEETEDSYRNEAHEIRQEIAATRGASSLNGRHKTGKHSLAAPRD